MLTKSSPEENYNIALDYAVDLDFVNAEKAFKEFLDIHKDSKRIADAQYWLGRVYFAQGKFEEAAICLLSLCISKNSLNAFSALTKSKSTA